LIGNSHLKASTPYPLEPRKTPQQGRSHATVEDILEATIQVLLLSGSSGVSTTRVAQRAGVSIGTLYQYFPNRQALLHEALRCHLDRMACTLEETCLRLQGQRLGIIIETVVDKFIDVKTESIESSRALYVVSAELKAAPIVNAAYSRVHTALLSLMETTSDYYFDNPTVVSFMFSSILSGPTCAVLDGHAPYGMHKHLREHLNIVATAYLMAIAKAR
jgi:AcrR family transcriptional regulator